MNSPRHAHKDDCSLVLRDASGMAQMKRVQKRKVLGVQVSLALFCFGCLKNKDCPGPSYTLGNKGHAPGSCLGPCTLSSWRRGVFIFKNL